MKPISHNNYSNVSTNEKVSLA